MQREVKAFLIVGGSTVLVDYMIYLVFIHVLEAAYAYAKAAGFLAGSLFAYFANSIWTFKSSRTRGNMISFAILYACTLLLNVAINSAVLRIGGADIVIIQLAFLTATIISAVSNFLGMKFLVFRKNSGNFP